MSALILASRSLQRFNDWVAKLVMAIGMAVIAFAVIALFVQAVERLVSGHGYAWMNDFPPFLLPWCVFPLMGVLLRGDRHIGVEVAPSFLKGRAFHALRLVIGLICLTSGLYFTQAGYVAVEFFQILGEVTETEIQIPFWYLYAAFPVGFGVFCLFALEMVLQELVAVLRGDDEVTA